MLYGIFKTWGGNVESTTLIKTLSGNELTNLTYALVVVTIFFGLSSLYLVVKLHRLSSLYHGLMQGGGGESIEAMMLGRIQDIETLRLFRENINELVIQTYQGSTTIANYQTYLKKVSAIKLPYKIGLVQHGEWNSNLKLDSDSNFKGYVVFLLRH